MGYVKYDKIPISVFPVPGGPNKRIPLGGERRPVNISGLSNGKTTISLTVFFTKSNPAISFQSVGFPVNKISEKDDYYVQACHGISKFQHHQSKEFYYTYLPFCIVSTIFVSMPLSRSSPKGGSSGKLSLELVSLGDFANSVPLLSSKLQLLIGGLKLFVILDIPRLLTLFVP